MDITGVTWFGTGKTKKEQITGIGDRKVILATNVLK